MEATYDRKTAMLRREARFASWLVPKDAQGRDLAFASAAAKTTYRASIERFTDALSLQRMPDRVPILALGTFMPTDVENVSPQEALYDYELLFTAHARFLDKYRPDYYGSPAFVGSGRVYDLLGLKQYRWPGRGLPADSAYQFVEGEYMQADEYPALIDDPSGFWIRYYLPRVFQALAPLASVTPFPHIWEIAGFTGAMIPFGLPPVQNALHALMAAGNEALRWLQHVVAFDERVQAEGFPTLIGAATKTPYDIIADTLRGTQGMMIDLYRQPDMVLRAMERLLPIYVQQGVGMATNANNPMVFIPLHKGADGFMSDKQFAKFYWPTLKALLIGLVNEGCVPFVFCEGSFNSRLEYLKELPPATTFWLFDRTDIVKAKRLLGDTICIGGNLPSGLLLTATPDEVRAHTRKMIDEVGGGGGYVLCNGTAMDEGNAANLHAFIESAREYGVYIVPQ